MKISFGRAWFAFDIIRLGFPIKEPYMMHLQIACNTTTVKNETNEYRRNKHANW